MNGHAPEMELSGFLSQGKVDTDFAVQEKFVVGICLLYPDRSAQEHEFMIREKSIVPLDGISLSECVQQAKDMAYRSAVSRLGGTQVFQFSTTAQQPARHQEPPVDRRTEEETEATAQAEEPEKEIPSAPAAPPDPEPPARQEPPRQQPAVGESTGSVQKLDWELGLTPASSLLDNAPEPEPEEEPDEDTDIQTAMGTKLTVMGKLHECAGMTAGEILKQKPHVIIELYKRYKGPNEVEKAVLQTLYPEACRLVNVAA